jgi:hypothetical protein
MVMLLLSILLLAIDPSAADDDQSLCCCIQFYEDRGMLKSMHGISKRMPTLLKIVSLFCTPPCFLLLFN